MGLVKQEALRKEWLMQVAVEIHRKAGNVDDAPDGTPCDNSNGDMTTAYMIGNALFNKRDPFVSGFCSRRELTNLIKIALDDLPDQGIYEEGLFDD